MAASAHDDRIDLLAPSGLDDHLRRIAPSRMDMDIGEARALDALLRARQDLMRQRFKRITDIALGASKLPHLIPGEVSPNGQNRQLAAHGLRKGRRNIGGTIGAARTVRGQQNVLHG
jgi:hypothetical protein